MLEAQSERGVAVRSRDLWFSIVAVALARPALAHHSFAAEFEAEKTAELRGRITQVWWANPHVRYRLEAKTAAGATEDWELQASSITALMAPWGGAWTPTSEPCGAMHPQTP